TLGFKDIPFIQRANRKYHYNLDWIKPDPLVTRKNCFEINERLTHKGEVLAEVDEEEVKKIAENIKNTPDIQAIAINTLYSYVDPVHEKQIKKIFQKYLPNIAVSISFDVLPKWKEYERASTVIADAIIKLIILIMSVAFRTDS